MVEILDRREWLEIRTQAFAMNNDPSTAPKPWGAFRDLSRIAEEIHGQINESRNSSDAFDPIGRRAMFDHENDVGLRLLPGSKRRDGTAVRKRCCQIAAHPFPGAPAGHGRPECQAKLASVSPVAGHWGQSHRI